MKKDTPISLFRLIFPLWILFNSLSINSQTPGVIFEGAPNTVLDPNGDGYVSLPPSLTPSQFTNIGFPPNINATDINDVLYSEIQYVGIPEVTPEPTGDPVKGPSCGFTDMVQDADSKSTYYYTDGTNMLFRFRLGDAKPNSKGYSVLIDTDEKFGFSGPNADPNAVAGNPGFEIEIVLRTNFEINAYNIDGTTEKGTAIASQPYSTHAIKSLALTTVCDDPDYFYDFYLSFTDVAGIDSSTTLRMVSVTSIAPKSVTGENTSSDIAGIDDSTAIPDSLFEELVEIQTPTNGTPLERSDCPLITGPIPTGTSVPITGTNTVETGYTTVIEIFLDGVSQGTENASGGTWNHTLAGPITEGQIVTATATVYDGLDVIKGTSIANCDSTIVSDTVCTPLATPVFSAYTNGGQKMSLTYAGGASLAAGNYLFNFYDASTGAQITTIDGSNVVDLNYTASSTETTTSLDLIGSAKFTDEASMNFIVKIDTDPATCESLGSEPISTCTSGTASKTPFVDPVNAEDTTITGNFNLDPPTSATLRLIVNGASTDITTTTTASANTFSFDISSLTLLDSDIIEVSNRDLGTACISTLSTAVTVATQSLKPSLNSEYCTGVNLISVSGFSAEIGGTIILYSKATSGVTTLDTNEGTATVSGDGSWTVSPVNIAPGRYLAATVQNTDETVSELSDEIQITSQTSFTTLVISSNPITEGDTSITGTSSGLTTGTTIQLYLDGAKAYLGNGSLATGITDGSGDWTISGLDTTIDVLYTNAVVTVTASESGECESIHSASKVVVCIPPAIPSISSPTSTDCENSIFSVTIASTESGVAYQLLDQDNKIVGPTILGDGASKDIDSDPIPLGTTALKVQAFKFGVSCTIVESNSVSITINPSPTISLGPNPSVLYNISAQTVNLTFSGTTNSPDEYKIDFDDNAFTDVAYTTLPASPISISVPAALAVGVYTATLTIKEPTKSCIKSYPITITILDPSSPTITLTNTNVDLCSGTTTADFVYSATTNTPTLYSINFNDIANLQGFIDLTDETLSSSPITITTPTNPDAGTYNGVITLKTAGGIISQEYPITVTVSKPNPGIVAGNQVINSGDDVAAFTSTEDGSGTYKWQSSTDGITFTDVATGTSATYDPDDDTSPTVTTYYKRITTSASCSQESNVITVTVINLGGTPMITQVYQVGSEKWIEVTNIHPSTSITGGNINVQLYSDVTRSDQSDVTPTATYTITTTLAAGQSALINHSDNVITHINGSSINENNDALTIFNGGNDIITLSTSTDNTSWDNRYDVVKSIADNTSIVRIDETSTTNTEYTENEWVVFVDDALSTIFNDFKRHPHAPLISEITSSNTTANTYLGLHNIGATTTASSSTWDNGFPDRSRYVIIDQNYKQQTNRLSARKLEVQGSNILSIDSQLLVVTDNLNINTGAEIRLLGTSQLIQTHLGAADTNGDGKIYKDQASDIASVYRYNYMSSPVTTVGSSTYTISDVLKDGTNPLSESGTVGQTASDIARNITFVDGFDGSTGTPINISTRWLYTFSSSLGQRSSWHKQDKNSPIPSTDGFIFKGPGVAQNYTFVGNPNDGSLITAVGANNSYLVGNPFPSALSALKFLNDNLASIDGTLYFWDHVGEEDNSSTVTQGHYYDGYIGGYATVNLSMGVSAISTVDTAAYTIKLEAEDSTNNGTQSDDGETTDVITLDETGEHLTFTLLSKPTEKITIRYKSSTVSNLVIKKDNITLETFELPSSSGIYTDFFLESQCFEQGSTLKLEATDTVEILIDYIVIEDDDGETACAPGTGSSGSYKTPGTHIPVGQGFFIEGGTSGGTIEFNNSQRENILLGANSVFFKSKSISTSSIPLIKLGMTYLDNNNEGKSFHRQIGVSFSPGNSFAFDKGYDSRINDINDTDFYWKFPNNNEKYVISGVQSVSQDLEIPLEIVIGNSGSISISLDQITNVNNNVFIIDKLTSTSYNIKDKKANIKLEKGTYTNRFVLAFKPSKSLNIDEILNDFTYIYTDNLNKLLVIRKKESINIKNVELHSILGKKVKSWAIRKQQEKFMLKIKRQLPSGFYIVKLETDKGNISKKIVIE